MQDLPTAPRHPWLRIIVAVLLGLVATLAAGVAASIVSTLPGDLRASYPWMMGAANHTGMLIAALLMILILARGRWGRFGFRRPAPFSPVRLLLLSGGFSVLAFVVGELLPGEGLNFLKTYTLPQEILFVWIYASLAEEVVSRGLIQGYLHPLRALGITIGGLRLSAPVLTGAIFFGAIHLMLFTMGIHPATVIMIAVFAVAVGMVAGYYRERSGSLWPAFLAHAFANVVGTALGLITGG